MSKIFGKKEEKVTDVDFTPVEELEEEVAAEVAEKAEKKAKKTKEGKDESRMKRYGKNALKVGAGALVGFIGAVVWGLTMSNKEEDDEDTDSYEEFEEDEETEE